MVTRLPDNLRAQRTIKLVKLYANIWAGSLFAAIGAGIWAAAGSSDFAWKIWGVCVVVQLISYLMTAVQTAELAQDLGRSYWAWALGALFLFPPFGLIVAYFRVKYLAMEHGVS